MYPVATRILTQLHLFRFASTKKKQKKRYQLFTLRTKRDTFIQSDAKRKDKLITNKKSTHTTNNETI
jgi:hypothetical protein